MNKVKITNSVQYWAIIHSLSDRIDHVTFASGKELPSSEAYMLKTSELNEGDRVVEVTYSGEPLDLDFEEPADNYNVEDLYQIAVIHNIRWSVYPDSVKEVAEFTEKTEALAKECGIKYEKWDVDADGNLAMVFTSQDEDALHEFVFPFGELREEFYSAQIAKQIKAKNSI